MATAAPDTTLFMWSKERLQEQLRPEPGSFFVEVGSGLGVSYGGKRTNVGGKGVVTDFTSNNLFSKVRRNEKNSDDLPYHNVEAAAGVLLGMFSSVN